MIEKPYLTAREAAAELGVSRATLYAYVSRGLIRSEETPGPSRAKQYAAADVAALQARKALRRDPAQAAEEALHFGQPVLASGLTLIANGRFYYRGHDALNLAQQAAFEQVARLLWQGELAPPEPFAPLPPSLAALLAARRDDLAALTPVEAFQAVLPLAAARDLAAYDLGAAAVAQTGMRILTLLTAVVTAVTADPHEAPAGIAAALTRAWAPDDARAADLVNAALILCADHELNVSAFAARTVASARATPYAAIIAGLAALQGQRHGGLTAQVDAFLREVSEPSQAQAVIARRLKRGETIPGFGHPLYPNGDPRGRALLAQVTAVYPQSPAVQLVQRVVSEMAQSVGAHPTIDLGLTALAWAAGLPSGAPLALFAIGRTAGWIAHALEQYAQDRLIRPRARYTGSPPRANS